MLGRQCVDQQEMLEKIAFCEELAKEEGCYEACYPFPSLNTRRAFLSGREVWKDQNLYDDTWGEVILMSGLPGTGKDYWIEHNVPHLPMISLDDIRKKHKIASTEEQGRVANIAREQANHRCENRSLVYLSLIVLMFASFIWKRNGKSCWIGTVPEKR